MNNSLVWSVGVLSSCLIFLPGLPGARDGLMAAAPKADPGQPSLDANRRDVAMVHMVGLKVQTRARVSEGEDSCPIDPTGSLASTDRWNGRAGAPSAMLGRLQ